MFIKKVTKKNGRTNKVYEYLHLVESIRTEKGPRQKLILNLGPLDIEPIQYPALAKRIEAILCGQESIFEIDAAVEKEAQTAAKIIFRKKAATADSIKGADFKYIDVESISPEQVRSIGAEYICHKIWQELGLSRFLKGHGVSLHVLPVIEALIIGRLIEAGSELHTKEWADKRSGLFELTGQPLRDSLNSYYRAGDALYKLKEPLEEYLAQTERTMFTLDEKIILIDLTNSFLTGVAANNKKAKRGRSKQKRNDCKLITLGLRIDEKGFIKSSRLFPGNQFEPETLSQMLDKMVDNNLLIKPTVVIDAGIATKDNIKWLVDNNYHYIAVRRGKSPVEFDTFSEAEIIKKESQKNVEIKVRTFKDDEEQHIVCSSTLKKYKEEGMRQCAETRFIEGLTKLKEGLSIKGRKKIYEKIMESIGRLKAKYPKGGKLYDVTVVPEKNTETPLKKIKATDIIWEKKSAVYGKETSKEGTYILRTNRLDLTAEEIWHIYVKLTRIENAFKKLKSDLGLRPNYHQNEKRIDTHMFIAVLAYHLQNIIEYRLSTQNDHRTWPTIKNILQTHSRVTISYKAKDENKNDSELAVYRLRLNSKPEPDQKEVYKKLGLSPDPLPRKILRTKTL